MSDLDSDTAPGPVPSGSPIRRARPRTTDAGRRAHPTAFSELLSEVRDAGLLEKRPRYYAGIAAMNAVVAVGAIVALIDLGPTPWQLLVAGVLGVVMGQFGFLAHEAAHRQVFEGGPANDLLARVVGPAIVGLSYTWWQQSHNRHHANPNVVDRDPSIEPQAFVFRPEDAVGRSGARGAFLRIQGYLLPPLLLAEGVNLRFTSLRAVIANGAKPGMRMELVLVVARLVALPALAFAVLPPGLALAFMAVQSAVFGLYLGGSFVPNHVGMPVLDSAHGLDYLRKQVLTSRNLSGGRFASFLTGGLSLQVEHHLFPGMARPNLLKARPIVQAHCSRLGIPYVETSIAAAFGHVIRYLNTVGLSRGTEFRCPMLDDCGRS